MGCDYWSHRVRIGIFHNSNRKLRKRNIKSNCLGTFDIILLFTISSLVLTVCALSLSEPSQTNVDSTMGFQSIGIKTDHTANETVFRILTILSTNATDYISPGISPYLLWPTFYGTDLDLEHNIKTITDPNFFGNFIGNKAAHRYFGNGRTPKYPCVTCTKAVTARCKAISCDLCEKWTHIRCSGYISNEKYNEIMENDTNFSFNCNTCVASMMPFQSESEIPTDISVTKPLPQSPVKNVEFQQFKAKGLHFVGLNVRSLLPKIEQLKIFTKSNNPAVLALCETWLDDSITPNEINIPGYNLERNDRNRQGGGVCLFIRDNLSYNIRKDLMNENIEAIWIDILLPKTRPILIGSIYRPPKQMDFLDNFENVMKDIDSSLETYIFGDINICRKSKNSGLFKSYSTML